jgi:hypothetical protein
LITLSDVYQPHNGVAPNNKGQQQVHDSHAKVKVLEVARRWGKGRCGFGEMMIDYFETMKRTRGAHLVPAWHAWIVVPTFSQGRQVWDEMMSFIPPKDKGGWMTRVARAESFIELVGSPLWNGGFGKIELKSADNPDTLQTTGLDFLWISEAQDISEEAYQKVVPATRSPEVNGKQYVEGIPAMYPDHWFSKMYDHAARQDHRTSRNFLAFKATYLDNPLISDEIRDEIEIDDRAFLPERAWRRMYLAERSTSAGFFKNIDQCISGDLIQAPIPGTRYVAGLDLGRRRDFTILFILDQVQRKVIYYNRWDPKYSWPDQRVHITNIFQDWGFHRLIIDSSGVGDVIGEELQNSGLPVEFFTITSENRTPLLDNLAVAMERETVHFPHVDGLVRELRAFQFQRTVRGRWRAEAPSGEHDDHVFALALGLTACDEPAPVEPRGRLRSRRYLPTQAEANDGGIRNVPQMVIERRRERSRRMEEALTSSGVEIE